jgi:iron complex outermembrane receptor protein
LRYSADDKSRQGRTLVASTGALNYENDASVSYGKATGKLGVDVDIAKGAIAYANLSTGYKAGGMYDGTSVVVNGETLSPTYKPETLTAIELGVKGRFLDNKLQFGASFFRYTFKDMQLSAIGLNAVATAKTGIRTEGNVTQNAGRALSQGLEFEGRWAPTDDDQIDFALGLLDAKYTRYVVSSTVDWTGKRLDKAPRQTLSLGWSHNWSLGGGAQLRAHLGTKYSAKYVMSNFGVAQFEQSSFHRSDASLTYRSADDRWYVQGYVKNIEDRNVMVSFVAIQNTAFLAEPRTYGLRAGITF